MTARSSPTPRSINEYLEDAFPDAPPLRPNTPVGNARMRYWNKFVDEHVMNFVSMHGWHRMVGIIARNIDSGEFEKLLENIPLHEQREKWRTARSGFARPTSPTHPQDRGRGRQGRGAARRDAWLAGDMFTLADINFYSHCGDDGRAHVPGDGDRAGVALACRMARPCDRPAEGPEALDMPDHTGRDCAPGQDTPLGPA
jgi:glutathione S-transferase